MHVIEVWRNSPDLGFRNKDWLKNVIQFVLNKFWQILVYSLIPVVLLLLSMGFMNRFGDKEGGGVL